MESILGNEPPQQKKPSFSVHTPESRRALNAPPVIKAPVAESKSGRSSGEKVVVTLAWIAVLGGVFIGFVVLVGGMAQAKSAPQEAVVVSLALACAILPYCFARAITELADISK